MGAKHILCYVFFYIIGKTCAAREASGSYCNPGHPGDGKCGEGEGDCDHDEQCLPGLKCGFDNCPKKNAMPRNFDCCYRPTPVKKCATSEASGSCCNPGHPGDGKCGEDEGDCDNDAQCLHGLKCGENNCPKENGMPSNFDCCYRPAPGKKCATSDASGSCCNPGHAGDGKCGEDEGDCDNDAQCLPGLKCGDNNCPKRNGMPINFDCCYRPTPAVDGGWTPWGSCSRSCKGGKQKRTCTNPPPSYDGKRCYGRNIQRCKRYIDCGVDGGWTSWGSCSKSCKGGKQKRTCTNPPPSSGHRGCYGRGEKRCNRNINCAVNGSWTPWGSCNKSCKGGEQKRICTNPPPSYGGRGCDGRNARECNSNIDCRCTNGIVTANLKIEGRSVPVRCEDSGDKKGAWTVIQRRGQYGNPEDYFDKSWNEYKTGFGSVHNEFWIGLQNIADLTKDGEWQLQVDLKDWDGKGYFALYNSFSVGSGPRYSLRVTDFDKTISTLGDSLAYHNGMAFSTKEKDQDTWAAGNCAAEYRGGWWYKSCHHSSLNNLNFNKQNYTSNGINWFYEKTRGNHWKTWEASVMKIRRVNI